LNTSASTYHVITEIPIYAWYLASLLTTRLIVEEISATVIIGHDPHNGSNNHFDDDDNNNDGHDFLQNLFFPPELDNNSIDTELNFKTEPNDLHKLFLKNTAPIAERSKTDNNADRN